MTSVCHDDVNSIKCPLSKMTCITKQGKVGQFSCAGPVHSGHDAAAAAAAAGGSVWIS